jgi:hypothetical protein
MADITSIIKSMNSLLKNQQSLLDLFDAVKLGEISDQIENLKNGYAEVLSSNPLNRTYYVNTNIGDDTNIGNSSKPLKTIAKAIDLVPITGYGIIILQFNSGMPQTFTIDSNIVIENKTILIQNSSITESTKNKITFTYYLNSEIPAAAAYASKQIILKSNSSLYFDGIEILTPNLSLIDYADPRAIYEDYNYIRNKVNLKHAPICLQNSTANISFNSCMIRLYSFDLIFTPDDKFSNLHLSFVKNEIHRYTNLLKIDSSISANKSYLLQVFAGLINILQINNSYFSNDRIDDMSTANIINFSDLIFDKNTSNSLINYNAMAGVI